MCSGKRPTGTPKGKQTKTMALCQTPGQNTTLPHTTALDQQAGHTKDVAQNMVVLHVTIQLVSNTLS